ncbi:MAG: DNRLRE domain-containing protein [Algibacter sp.]
MKTIKKQSAKLYLITINSFIALFLLSTALFAQNSPYQAIRLNNGDPIIEPSMFSNYVDANNLGDGADINGPSLIRIPDWIPTNQRADVSALYYLYFAHHSGDYIRMAWAANIEGPYTLYNDFTTPGDRGVLDNNESDIILNNNIYIEENHLASPDVIIDDVNQRIIMYFHSGSSYYVNNVEQNDQVTWVSTSPYGLEFYNGIESVHLGSSYFRVFEYDGDLYALDNGGKTNKALDGANPWAIPSGHDFTTQLWDRASDNGFGDDIPVPTGDLRVRHTGVRVVGDQLHAFYSRRGDLQERIQLSTIDMTVDWESWDPTYPPIDILTPNPGWEGGNLTMDNSKTSDAINVNQLRDPDIFEDTDGQLYLIYTGSGEGGLGIAKLYETPTTNLTLTTLADAHVKESSTSNFGELNNLTASIGSSSSNNRTIYMRFDLSSVVNIEHAMVRLYLNETDNTGTSVLDEGGPVTVYETSNSWDETTVNNSNAPLLGDPITTTYLTSTDTYYDWNISEYAKANEGNVISVAFHIAPSNDASFKFDSVDNITGNPGQLLLTIDNGGTLSTESVTKTTDSKLLQVYPNPFKGNYTLEIADYDGQSEVAVELINLSNGALISKETYNQSIIEFKDIALATGVYALRVSYNNSKSLVKKMIKVD